MNGWAPVLLAGVVALSAAANLYIGAYLRRREKEQEWERQDEVARRVEEAAKALEQANAEALASSGQVVAKLEDIHALVNSDKTAAMDRELSVLVANQYLMEKNVDWERSQGDEPTEEMLGLIEATKTQIGDLRDDLAERKRVQAEVDALRAGRGEA